MIRIMLILRLIKLARKCGFRLRAYIHNERFPGQRKLKDPYCGPFQLTEQVSPVSWRLDLPATMRIHPVFHVSQLKVYVQDHYSNPNHDIEPPPLRIVDGLEVYNINHIIKHRDYKSDRKYLVSWEGYPDAKDYTWQWQKQLVEDVPVMVKEYDLLHPHLWS